MNTKHATETNEVDYIDLLESFRLTKVERSRFNGGTWAKGMIGGHKFEALVFPEHAESELYELAKSRISKIWVTDPGRRTVAAFDRGWELRPTTPMAEAIVDSLSEGLAETVFG